MDQSKLRRIADVSETLAAPERLSPTGRIGEA
jgi:hypothetical protein